MTPVFLKRPVLAALTLLLNSAFVATQVQAEPSSQTPPRTFTTQKALASAQEVQTLLRSGAFDAVEAKLQELATARERTPINEPPLIASALRLFEPPAYGFEQPVRNWVAARPKSAFAHAILASWSHAYAWEARGVKFMSDVPTEAAKLYSLRIAEAAAEADSAYAIDSKNPLAAYERLDYAKELPKSPAQKRRLFEEANAICPNSFVVHLAYQSTLSPKWGGESEEGMFRFARDAAAHGAPDSALPALIIMAQDDVCFAHGGKKSYLSDPKVWGERQKAYETINSRFPESASYLALYAGDCLLLGRAEEGLKLLTRAKQTDQNHPDVVRVMQKYGHLLDKAPGSAEAATDSSELIMQQAGAAYSAKRLDEAAKLCEQALKANPGKAYPWAMLGAIATQQQHYAEAVESYEKATALSSRNAKYFTQLCYARMMNGQLEKGVDDCTKAIAIDSSEKFAYLNRARAFEMLGKTKEAQADYQVAGSLP